MEQVIKINYRSVFKYEDHNESVDYHEVGTLNTLDEGRVISFSHDGNHMEIGLYDSYISLRNGKANLKLVQDRRILNQYVTDYGIMDLTTKLVSQDTNNGVKIKYQLYDGGTLMSEVYVLVTYVILEN